MNLYAEASAVLSWLLAEDLGESARSQLSAAAGVSTSDLTLIECDRALRRAVATARLTAGVSFDDRIRGNAAALGFDVVPSLDGRA